MPKVVDHAARRAEVAAAVLAVIGRVGLEGATLREVAREAGCTTGALSHYFRDKHDLVMFAFQLSSQQFTERVNGKLQGIAGLLAVRTALHEVLPIGDQRVISAIWLSFDARAVSEPDLAVEHRLRYRGWRERLMVLLKEAVYAGEIDDALDLEVEAEVLTGFALGVSLQALIDPERFTPERLTTLVNAKLAALAARGSDTHVRRRRVRAV